MKQFFEGLNTPGIIGLGIIVFVAIVLFVILLVSDGRERRSGYTWSSPWDNVKPEDKFSYEKDIKLTPERKAKWLSEQRALAATEYDPAKYDEFGDRDLATTTTTTTAAYAHGDRTLLDIANAALARTEPTLYAEADTFRGMDGNRRLGERIDQIHAEVVDNVEIMIPVSPGRPPLMPTASVAVVHEMVTHMRTTETTFIFDEPEPVPFIHPLAIDPQDDVLPWWHRLMDDTDTAPITGLAVAPMPRPRRPVGCHHLTEATGADSQRALTASTGQFDASQVRALLSVR